MYKSYFYLLENYKEWNAQITDIFIDLEKAYDNILKKKLGEERQIAGIEGSVIEFMKILNAENMCQTKIGTNKSKRFKTSKGLLQSH